MAAGNCVSPHMAAGNGLHSRSDLVILWMTLSTKPCPIRLLSDSAALLERFARTIFRTKIDAATRNNKTGKR